MNPPDGSGAQLRGTGYRRPTKHPGSRECYLTPHRILGPGALRFLGGARSEGESEPGESSCDDGGGPWRRGRREERQCE